MGKDYLRIDDRLIHGQIVTAWCRALEIKEIVAIDDKLASNPTLQSIMMMGIPSNYRHHVVTFDQARKIFAEQGEGNRLFVTRMPQDLANLREELLKCDTVFIGNAAKRPETKFNLTKGGGGVFFASVEDVKLFDELCEAGIKLIAQTVPNTSARPWPEVRKSIKL
ncbi:MAG: PTS mannose/fructose/sorbose transporter subunit IIB [Firmicutes bacterium HGW-Firmicutes-16]|nr:MAG: PTS mannose/fructose/sorbose transporter subunit IIB [Firmicutes bacterium HGW-Firmicutes-16]